MNSKSPEFHDYVSQLQTASKDKNDTMHFFTKFDYLNSLVNYAIQQRQEHIHQGYGDLNANICFIFPTEETFNIVKPVIQSFCDNVGINLWDVYITFIKKSQKDAPDEFDYLLNEIRCVKPCEIIIFDNNQECFNRLIESNVNYAYKHFEFTFINISKLLSNDDIDKQELYHYFLKLIPYRTI